MFKRIRQFFCRHHFTPNKFVALNHRGWTETCDKCGKCRSHDA